MKRQTVWIAALFLLFTSGSLWAQTQPVSTLEKKGELVTLDFKDVELTALVKTISELTGKNFVYDNTLKGTVTLISPQEITVNEAYDLLLAVLNQKGFTVVPSGRIHKIVSTRSAKEENLPVGRGVSEQYVTRLIPLKNVDAGILATTVLAPLIPKTSSVVAYAPTNTLVVTDNGANIDRLVQIIRELDISGKLGTFEVIPLMEGSAEEIAAICNQMLEESQQDSATTAAARRQRRISQTGGGKILAYPRTNSLIVMASGSELETIREWISKLDQKRESGQSNIHVYYLENADAETLAKTLNELLAGTPLTSGGTAGSPAAQSRSAGTFITADIPTNSLIINAPPAEYEIIEDLIRGLDILRKQVYVEALVMELSLDATRDLGISLQGAADVGSESVIFGTSNLNTGRVSLSDLTPVSGTTIPNLLARSVEGLMLGGLFNPITVTGLDGQEITIPAFSALLHLSKVTGDVNILSAPRLLTSDNEEAEIVVGANVPIVTGTLTDAVGADSLAQSQTIERQDVALTLRFTPQITQGNLIRLEVYQEMTDLVAGTLSNVNGPTWTKRLIKNTVLAEDSQTVVLGGLIGTNTQESISKVPLLGDIPLLGWLFKSKNTTEQKTNLMVFITPKIIGNAGDLKNITMKNQALMHRLQMGTEALEEMLSLEGPEKRTEKPSGPLDHY